MVVYISESVIVQHIMATQSDIKNDGQSLTEITPFDHRRKLLEPKMFLEKCNFKWHQRELQNE